MSTQFASNIFKPEKTHHLQILPLYNTKASIITNLIKKTKSIKLTKNGILTTIVLTLIIMTKIPCHKVIEIPRTNINNY